MSLVMLLLVAQLQIVSFDSLRSARTTAVSARTPTVALMMIGVGGASVLAGALVGALGFIPATSELDAMCPSRHCQSAARPVFERAGTLGVAGNLTAGIGAFYLVAGFAWWLAARFDRAPPMVVTPAFDADGLAFVASGRF